MCASVRTYVCVYIYVCRMDDQILSVNGNSMENVSHAQAVQALKDAGSTVVLIVRHGVGLAVSRSVSPPHRNTPPRSPEPPFITVVLEKAPGRGEQERCVRDWVKGEGLCTYVGSGGGVYGEEALGAIREFGFAAQIS